jgi:L-arabinose isomerase
MALAESREFWLITGSQHLYGDEEMQTVATAAREVAAAQSAADGMQATVVAGPVVTTAEAVRIICRQANTALQCKGVIFWIRTFAPARMWSSHLGELEKPFCFLHDQPSRTIPRSSHRHRPTTIVGHHRNPAVTRALTDWSRAALGSDEAQSLVVAALGDNTALGDDAALGEHGGFRVAGVEDSTVAAHAEAVTDPDITHLVELYEESYEVAESLKPNGTHHDQLRTQARVEIGVSRMLSAGGYRGFTTAGGSFSGLAVQRLMAAGYGFGPDGDWRTAALVRILKSIGDGPGGTTFLEDSTYVRHASGMAVFGPHMLELCPSVADPHDRPKVEVPTLGDRSGAPRLVFGARPGNAVNTGFVRAGAGMLLIANSVQMAGSPAEGGGSSVSNLVLNPRPDLATASECWALAGGVRYTALTTNVTFGVLETWAGIAGVGFVGIRSETSSRSFRKQLRGAMHEVH